MRARLERLAEVLRSAEYSPSSELRALASRLLEAELRDVEWATLERERREVEEFRHFAATNPAACPVHRICEESRARVRSIMGRGTSEEVV